MAVGGVTERLAFLITANPDQAIKAFTKVGAAAEKDLGKAEAKLDKLSGSMIKFGGGAAAFATVAGAALFKAGQAAGDVAESMSKVTVLFGEQATEIDKWSRKTASSIGLSRAAALEAAGTFGVMAKSMNKTGEDASDFAVSATELAADLASFSNTSPDEAILALGAALRGESEPIRRFGVLLDDATLKQRALSMGLIETTTGTLPPAIRAQAAYAEILAQTTAAQGDFARTSDGLAGQQKILAARMDDLKVAIGEGVLPLVSALVGGLADLSGAFTSLDPETQRMIGSVAGIGTAALGAAGAISFVAGQVIKMRDRFVDANGALNLFGKTALGVTGIITAAGIVYVGYSQRKAEATQRTQTFVAALEAEANGQLNASNAALARILAGEKVQQQLQRLSDSDRGLKISTEDLARAIKGETVPAVESLLKSRQRWLDLTASGVARDREAGASALQLTIFIEQQRAAFESATRQVDAQTQALKGLKAAQDAVLTTKGVPVVGGSGTTGNLQRRASGGPAMPGSYAIVGEDGPELVRFTAGAQVSTAGQTRDMLAGGASAPEVVAAIERQTDVLASLLRAVRMTAAEASIAQERALVGYL